MWTSDQIEEDVRQALTCRRGETPKRVKCRHNREAGRRRTIYQSRHTLTYVAHGPEAEEEQIGEARRFYRAEEYWMSVFTGRLW
jgi:hypothetical protein